MIYSVYSGDCLKILPHFESKSVHACVTSPPYFGLRDYGVAGQMGLEKTPEEYVANLVAVFEEVRRVLRDDGTLWLNLGDSYSVTSHLKQSGHVGAREIPNTRISRSIGFLSHDFKRRGKTMNLPAKSNPNTAVVTSVQGLLVKFKDQIQAALPKGLTAERLSRIALTELRKNPKLLECEPTSFMGAVMQCAQLGLEPGSELGHVYLVPYENRRANKIEVQLQIGYRGMLDLTRRSGQIRSISAHTVHEKDQFHYAFGLQEKLEHVPAPGDRGEMIYVYAVAFFKDGGYQFEVLSKKEVEKSRDSSRSGKFGPWVTHFDEMAKKTAIRKLFKYLPISIEVQKAVGLDELAEAGVSQDNDAFLMGESASDASGGAVYESPVQKMNREIKKEKEVPAASEAAPEVSKPEFEVF